MCLMIPQFTARKEILVQRNWKAKQGSAVSLNGGKVQGSRRHMQRTAFSLQLGMYVRKQSEPEKETPERIR